MTHKTHISRLAVDGGTPVRTRPFAPWPHFAEDEIEAAVSVLRSGKINYWTGSEGRAFETEYAAKVACKHAIALANGTVALELALFALGIGAGDEVIVPSRTFIASASCAVMRGARPIIADVDPLSQTITAASVQRVLTPRTRAIIAVHLAGWPCDMDPIMELAREHGLKVVEDCAQAHGARYKFRPVGSLGDVAAFSFCQDKILTTGGEGGMLTTNDYEVWERSWSYKDHGKSFLAMHGPRNGQGFRWVHDSFGTNWRMTEMQAAIGRVLLRKLEDQVLRRNENAAVLGRELARIPALEIAQPPRHIHHAYYKYYVRVRPEWMQTGWNRDRVLEALCAEGIPCFTGSCSEIYRESAFSQELRPRERLPVAQSLGERSLMFLVHPTLSVEDMLDVSAAVEKVFEVASSPAQTRLAV